MFKEFSLNSLNIEINFHCKFRVQRVWSVKSVKGLGSEGLRVFKCLEGLGFQGFRV